MLRQQANADPVSVLEATRTLLRQLGMTTIFGNPGSTEIPFLRDWPADFDYVLGLQESSVLAMADGYAQASGNAALVNLHSAAGLGHALGNLMTAYRNNAPLVIIAGQQTRSLLPLQPYLFAEAAADFPRPYVKWSCEPARAEDVPAAIARAYHTAMAAPCGPTFLSVPADDWEAMTRHVPAHRVSRRSGADPDLVAELARALNACTSPVLVVGAQIDREQVWAETIELAERIGAPVWMAPRAYRAAFPENHPQFAGFLPAVPEAVSQALSQHDLVLVIGSPVFTFHVPGEAPILNGSVPLYHLTDDPTAAACAPAGVGLCGSLSLALPALLRQVARRERSKRPRRAPAATPAADIPLSPDFVMHAIARHMPVGSVIVEEAPSHRGALQRQIFATEPGSFYTMSSGGLGYSLPASVGIALAQPSRRVIAILGDGATMYSPQAIWTAVQRNLRVSFIVLNNSGYGAMRAFSRILGGARPPGIDLPGLHFTALAAAMGCPSSRVSAAEALQGALDDAMASDGPYLLEVEVGRDIAGIGDI